jgi:hypothetical protein
MDSQLAIVAFVTSLMRAAPWLLLGTAGALFLTRSSFGRALTHRLRQGSGRGEELATLTNEIEQLRRDLSEVQERLDFTERLLTQLRELPALSSPPDTPTPPEPAAAGRSSARAA